MMFGASVTKGLAVAMRIFLEQPDQMGLTGDDLMALAQHVLVTLGSILAPVFAVMMASAIAGHVLQSRPSFTLEKIKPDFSKLSLFSGLKRMFGPEGLMNLVKGLLKIGVVGIAVWTQIWPERNMLESVLDQSPMGVIGDMSHLLYKVLLAALVSLAVIAVADYALQRYRFIQRNKMSKQEIKEEYKQNEGDPQIKAKIRQLRMERAKKRMIAAVPEATVIITNPTHYAIALRYESGKMAAPICVAKGIDALALKIREVAAEHNVPIVENPPLARALHATVEVDEVIPAEHFKAVAQVIGYVMRLTGKIRAN
jgi:flagellar biosynthetic protein FlhB